MIRDVRIVTIDHNKQRYDTVGDWVLLPDGVLLIFVSKMSDWRMSMMVAQHELTEAIACTAVGISPAQVDQFDFNFTGPEEPGDDPEAPYHEQHVCATLCERTLCHQLKIDWELYDEEVNNLFK